MSISEDEKLTGRFLFWKSQYDDHTIGMGKHFEEFRLILSKYETPLIWLINPYTLSTSTMKTRHFALIFIPLALLYYFHYLKPNVEKNQSTFMASIDLNEVNDTASKEGVYPRIFEVAFQNPEPITNKDRTFKLKAYQLGNIKLESGKIIACDPINMYNAEPFIHQFDKGEFPVQIAVAQFENDRRVAYSRIRFSNKKVMKWEFARRQGQVPRELIDSKIYCYPVDMGTGIFIDSVANHTFTKMPHPIWESTFVKVPNENNGLGFIKNFGPHKLATFSTGYGDGCYATYIGTDSTGEITTLLTDFGLVPWWKVK